MVYRVKNIHNSCTVFKLEIIGPQKSRRKGKIIHLLNGKTQKTSRPRTSAQGGPRALLNWNKKNSPVRAEVV